MIEFLLSISNHLFFLLFLTIILIVISLLLELHRVLKGGVHAINIDMGKGDFVSFFCENKNFSTVLWKKILGFCNDHFLYCIGSKSAYPRKCFAGVVKYQSSCDCTNNDASNKRGRYRY